MPITTGDPASEWRRSDPDIVVYIPRAGERNDTDNEHFLVFESPGGDLLAMWTQSSCEGRGDNHIVLSRSRDGHTWGEPLLIAGTRAGTDDLQASWGFPLVADSGRIYCLYTRETPVVDNNRQGCGAMGCAYSDDDGHTWTLGADIPMARNRFDHPDPEVPRNWIVWQKPIRDSRGRWVVGYTQCTSKAHFTPPSAAWPHWDSRSLFMRFDNVEQGPDPEDLQVTWLPEDGEGLEVADGMYPEVSVCQEPSVVLLPDGRLFCTMRTMTGEIWTSVSKDDAHTWREPEVLRRCDEGEPMHQPIAPCPIYDLGGGRYLLVFHNNPGKAGEYDQFAPEWKTNVANYTRHPAFIALGQFRPHAKQPVWFGEPLKLLDTDGVLVGPKATAEIATYTSMTHYRGETVLWYPDRKFYLLGKILSDELIRGLGKPRER